MFSDLGKHMGRKGAALTALAVFLAATVIPLVACAISLAVDVYSVPGLVLVLYSSLVGAMALVVTFKYPRWSTIVYLFLLDVLCIAVINEIIWFFVSRSMAEGGILLMDLVPSLVFLLVGSGLACALRAVGERTSPSNPPYREDIKHLAVWALTGQDESAEDGSGKKGFAAAGKVLSATFSTVRTAPAVFFVLWLILVHPATFLVARRFEALTKYGPLQPLLYIGLPLLAVSSLILMAVHPDSRLFMVLAFLCSLVALATYIYPAGGDPVVAPSLSLLACVLGAILGSGVHLLAHRGSAPAGR